MSLNAASRKRFLNCEAASASFVSASWFSWEQTEGWQEASQSRNWWMNKESSRGWNVTKQQRKVKNSFMKRAKNRKQWWSRRVSKRLSCWSKVSNHSSYDSVTRQHLHGDLLPRQEVCTAVILNLSRLRPPPDLDHSARCRSTGRRHADLLKTQQQHKISCFWTRFPECILKPTETSRVKLGGILPISYLIYMTLIKESQTFILYFLVKYLSIYTRLHLKNSRF